MQWGKVLERPRREPGGTKEGVEYINGNIRMYHPETIPHNRMPFRVWGRRNLQKIRKTNVKRRHKIRCEKDTGGGRKAKPVVSMGS